MKVLMIGWELPPHNSGGLGVACLGLARAMSKKGVDITFVLPRSQNYDYDFMNIVFADIEEESELLKSSYTNTAMWFSSKKCCGFATPDYVKSAVSYAKKVRQLAKKMDADVIHVHDWMTFGAGIAAKEVMGKPLVAHIHNTVFDRGGGSYNPYEYELEKSGFIEADKVVAVSNLTKNIVVDKYGIDEKKVGVVYNGVDEFAKKPLPLALKPLKDLGYKIVLFLGRITLQKGPDYFVKAAKKVSELDPKVIFIVTGSGDMQEQMMNEAVYMGMMDKFIFTGFLRGEEKDRIWQAADLFVSPSISEPFGITALESVANRTPVLVSKQSGVSEVLKHALKVDFWDIDEMANKIIAVLAHKELGSDLRTESIKELRDINWDRAAEGCLSVYRELT